MKVLYLAPYLPDTAPSQRYRFEQWQPHLERMGVEIAIAPFVSYRLNEALHQPGRYLLKAKEGLAGFMRRFGDMKRASDFDLVFLHREASLFGPALFERILKWQRLPMVYEMDDAVFVPYVSPANRWLSYLKFPGKAGTICALASHVIVGSHFLAEYAGRYNPNVTIIPTTVDTEVYAPRRFRQAGKPLCIGWCGSHSTTRYLKLLVPALEELRRNYDFRLLFVGAWRFDVGAIETEFREWTSRSEVEDLAEMDIGVMPVPDEEWARGKQGLKALLYMSMEIPVVASPVGANKEIIRDGANGFLASSEQEWVDKLGRLICDPELRRKLGMAGRQTVLESYSARVHVPRVYEVLMQSLDAHGRRRRGWDRS